VARTRVISGLSFLLLFAITASLVRRYDLSWRELLGFGTPAMHVAALGLVALELIGRSLRIAYLARSLHVPLTVRQGLTVQIAADGAAAITPARLGADPAKLFMIGRAGSDLPRSGAILAGEAVSEAIVLALLVAAIALCFGGPGLVALGALSYVVSTGALVVLALVASGPTRKRILRVLPMPARWRLRAVPAMHRFARHARRLLMLPARVRLSIALATLLHITARVSLLPLLCIGRVDVASFPSLVAWAFTLLYAGALVPLPSAGGAIELGFTAALGSLMHGPVLIVILLWWRIYTFYLGALTGALLLATVRKSA
jgi:uncharacterized membrane protein YbhN (UPF0104 family)